jgi:hypothetical protein
MYTIQIFVGAICAWLTVGLVVRALELAGRMFAETQDLQIGIWGPIKTIVFWPLRLLR